MPFQTLLWETQCKTHYYHFHDCPSGHIWSAFLSTAHRGEILLMQRVMLEAGQLELMKVSHPHIFFFPNSVFRAITPEHLEISHGGRHAQQKLPETFSSFHLCALECWLLNIYQHTIRHRLPIQFQTIPNLGRKDQNSKYSFYWMNITFAPPSKLKILSCNPRSWERLYP